ncbi:uncharacterized protein LOC110031995 isoform X2 [Phalaenopsis equestris]|uniref:uncharacterized protein LOC110031995 isoform X2 n=1 Tax=Phalaenopsis equestris TaxID=78828 RepID=UPI0009E2BBD5|nr:uncharacterized protein LOC110031995 isoform X2 [Phalaenopsis equestris]
MHYNRPFVFVDPYHVAYEHGKKLECALHLEESAEVPLYKLDHGNYQISDMEFNKLIAEALENGKRHSDNFGSETGNKRAKKEDHAGKLRHFEGNSPITITSEEKPLLEVTDWKTTASVVNANGKRPAATNLVAATRQGQAAWVPFFPGYEYLYRAGFDQLEDLRSPLLENSHRKCIPIGPDHQADLPQWTPQDFQRSGSQLVSHAYHSAPSNVVPSPLVTENIEVSADKCDCSDEGSIRCVRQHVMKAREKLEGSLGKKFIELGFSEMGEDVVAQRWTDEEENLFKMIVLSNSASLGRNFWTVLPHNFPSRSCKELVSYYFNVYVLRKRAVQNRIDPSNVDSDDDEWRESSDGEFETSEEEEEEDSVVNDDASEELDFYDEDEYEKHLVVTEDERFCLGSDGSTACKSMPPCKQSIDENSRDCSSDRDAQDESCTSFEGPCNVSDSCMERDGENLNVEPRNSCVFGFGDYEYVDGSHDSKPWEINYVRAREEDFDFFPTCNVLEEVFGKGM